MTPKTFAALGAAVVVAAGTATLALWPSDKTQPASTALWPGGPTHADVEQQIAPSGTVSRVCQGPGYSTVQACLSAP